MNDRDRNSTSPRRGEVGAHGAPGEGGLPSPRLTPPHPDPLPTGERETSAGAPGESRWRRRARYAAIGLGAMVCVATGGLWGLIDSFGPAPLGHDLEVSKTVLDRNGRLLRSYTTSQGRWRLPATRAQVDPRFLDMLLAYEDKRFWHHRGVDPLAFGRAALQVLTHGHIVSGGSTITMQVARLMEPRPKRSLYAKIREAVRAVELEAALSKDEILRLYLTLAPYGGNLEGTRAASLAYFGKEPRRLTLGEAALLVALPQAPELRRPDRFHAAAKRARDRVLDRMARYHLYSDAEIARAKQEPVPFARKQMPLIAPHAADDALAIEPNAVEQRLTIDAVLQQSLEQLALDRARTLGPDMSVAIMVVDNATGEVLARVASPDYFDERRAGQVDLTRAVRSPGSALKPFIYGLGFEDGLIHPETLIEDRPIRYGSYAPENFDLTFQGTVTVRRALQQSLNVPAVAVLEEVGPSRLIARLGEAGASLVLPRREAPGLALGLGGVGIRLADLTMLYAGFARGGTVEPLTEQLNAPRLGAKRLLEPVAAWYVARILQGTPPPENAAGGRIAFKTGTSYGYRDAWAVGFDGKRSIGVWVGRPDGAPVAGLAGRTAAAPILFDAFARGAEPLEPLPPAPAGALITTTAKLPPPLQRFAPHAVAAMGLTPLHIVFPPDGASLELSGEAGDAPDPMPIKISGGTPPLTVLLNGMPLDAKASDRTVFFAPDGPGFVRLTVTDATGAADSVLVRLQ
jgi:penicillin-binding protein 1C